MASRLTVLITSAIISNIQDRNQSRKQMMTTAQRLAKSALLICTTLLPAHLVLAQGVPFAKIEIQTSQLAPGLYLLKGSPNVDPVHKDAAGGAIGLLVGPEGVFMVDAQYAPITDKVLGAVHKLTPQPIRFLVNTHVHLDHSGGDAAIVKTGALLLAREELREEMALPLPSLAGDAAPPADPARLPVITYGMGAPLKIRMNGETIDLIPMPAAHTGGDTLVRFENAKVIMTGDFYRSYGYPFFDVTRGGTLNGTVEALNQLIDLADANTKIVPGHGAIANRADVVRFRDMIVDLQGRIQKMVDQGKSESEVVSAHLTAPYDSQVQGGLDPVSAGGVTTADRFVSGVYKELAHHR
jgi:cyclase